MYASLTPAFTTKTAVSEHTDWADWKANWDKIKTNYEQVALIPGSDFSKLNFGWYSKEKANEAVVRIADNKDMKNAKEFKGTCTEGTVINGVQYYSNKVTADGFEPNTTYYYQVKLNGKWQQAHEYKTGDPHNFSFMYVGDPQIGASKGQVPNESAVEQSEDVAARNDAYNWNKTLNSALAQHPEINFLVSPGDQINEPAGNNAEKHLLQEYEYSGYLSATAFRNLPQAVAIGNHDCLTTSYQNHFNVPNPFTAETNSTVAGHGYYYTYGSALFIVINANNYNAADHKALIEKAIKENPNAKWKVVMFHQDIYGSGYDHSDSDGMVLRTQLTPLMDKYDIDVVLQGHDHTYSRTYQLQSDGQAHDKFAKTENTANYAKENNCYEIVDTTKGGTVVNPKGTVYLEANSATGSKFYNLITAKQDFISERSQTWTPSYSVVNVTDDSFEVTTYDADTGKVLDGSSSYKIVKKAEDTKKDDANSNTTKKDDITDLVSLKLKPAIYARCIKSKSP